MKAAQARNKFGRVFQITEPDYVKEVTEASAEADVVLLLTCAGFRLIIFLNIIIFYLS